MVPRDDDLVGTECKDEMCRDEGFPVPQDRMWLCLLHRIRYDWSNRYDVRAGCCEYRYHEKLIKERLDRRYPGLFKFDCKASAGSCLSKPDAILDYRRVPASSGLLIVETDEHHHMLYAPSHERLREWEIAYACDRWPAVYVRWNPHIWHHNGVEVIYGEPQRLRTVLEVVDRCMQSIEQWAQHGELPAADADDQSADARTSRILARHLSRGHSLIVIAVYYDCFCTEPCCGVHAIEECVLQTDDCVCAGWLCKRCQRDPDVLERIGF